MVGTMICKATCRIEQRRQHRRMLQIGPQLSRPRKHRTYSLDSSLLQPLRPYRAGPELYRTMQRPAAGQRACSTIAHSS